ncbi:MAG: imidazole glycerol phosphate synthase subunit HisH [Oscillospiraceae bacterium]|jgi:glutamine amidotransferase|nr:imidazole glycerol phosphate synthase subunit HisH [Oscillospiraceae bacterium]
MLAIIDYGAGNLQSVKKALQFIGETVEITSDTKTIERADGVLLPGVGSFGDVMHSMRKRGLVDCVRALADGSRPFLGICLGLQLLFAHSDESPEAVGLDVLPGEVLRIPQMGLKVPHIGWNAITLQRHDGVFVDVPNDVYVYFVHSFYVKAGDIDLVAAQTRYGVTIDAAVTKGLLTATQFHPEKSGDAGLQMLRNFAILTR